MSERSDRSCWTRGYARAVSMAGMMMPRLVSLAFALCLAAPVFAAEVAGVTLADEAFVDGQVLVLNGAGLFSKFFFKIYVGSLYLPQRLGDVAGVLAKGPRRIQMNFLRKLTLKQLVDALVGGLNANNSPAEMAAVRAPTEELLRIMNRYQDLAVKEGDILTMDFSDGATRVALNGEAGGTIQSEAFNMALTRIWIGDRPAHRNLKKALLGG
jgi:Chalcone isomerase-like